MNRMNKRSIAFFTAFLSVGLLWGCGGSDAQPKSEKSSGEEITLPETPSREEVQAELREHAAHISNCGLGGGEGVPVMITFEGASGSVSRIEYPEGEELARSVRICIESNLVNAAISPFLRESFTITYPFKLREELRRPSPVGAAAEAEAEGGSTDSSETE